MEIQRKRIVELFQEYGYDIDPDFKSIVAVTQSMIDVTYDTHSLENTTIITENGVTTYHHTKGNSTDGYGFIANSHITVTSTSTFEEMFSFDNQGFVGGALYAGFGLLQVQ